MRDRVVRLFATTVLFSLGLCLIAPAETPTPAAVTPAKSSTASTSSVPSGPLPAPFSKELFTFLQIEQQKSNLSEQVVQVEIDKLLGAGKDVGNNLLRFIAKDTSNSATPFGQVAFPRDGLEKADLRQQGKGPLVVYFRVHVSSPKAAALCEAVGTKFSPLAQGSHYEW